MKKMSIIFLIIFFGFFFINGFFLDKRHFEEQINGLVLEKSEGSRGSVILRIKPSSDLDSIEFSFGGYELYSSIQIGDSVVKKRNSYSLYLYKKKKYTYELYDSIEIYHW